MTETKELAKELKPKSFRIDEETAEKFKAISQELGNNQQQTLSKLIETYEFQKGKSVLSQKQGEIETFEKYVTVLTRMYMASLEDNQNVTTTVQAEFEALLSSKDETIMGLQDAVKQAKEESLLKEEEAKKGQEETTNLNKEIDGLQQEIAKNKDSYDAMINEKEKLISALTQASEHAKKEALDMQKANLERNAIATKHMQLQQEFKALSEEHSALKNELERVKLAHERELLTKESSFQERMQELEDRRKKEIDAYQEKYLEVLQQLHQATKPVEPEKKEIKEKEENKE